jgi:hypothetical protein
MALPPDAPHVLCPCRSSLSSPDFFFNGSFMHFYYQIEENKRNKNWLSGQHHTTGGFTCRVKKKESKYLLPLFQIKDVDFFKIRRFWYVLGSIHYI